MDEVSVIGELYLECRKAEQFIKQLNTALVDRDNVIVQLRKENEDLRNALSREHPV